MFHVSLTKSIDVIISDDSSLDSLGVNIILLRHTLHTDRTHPPGNHIPVNLCPQLLASNYTPP